jgi:hypothetical protein
VPEPIVAEVHVDVVMDVDILVHIKVMGPFSGSLNRALDDMRVHVANASMIGAVDDRRLVALDRRAGGLAPGRRFTSLRRLGSLGLLLMLLGIEDWPRDQEGR